MDYSGNTFFVTNIVEILQKSGEKQFMLEFRFDCSSIDGIKVKERLVYMLVDARSNYIGIWTTKNKWKTKWDLRADDFQFQSCHDSCWRSDGMQWIFKNYIEMRDELYKKLEEQGGDPVNLYQVNAAISFSPSLWFKNIVEFETKGRTEIVDFKVV